MHGGKTLKEALSGIQADALFWTLEVYEHIRKVPDSSPWGAPPPAKGMSNYKGHGKGKQSSWNKWTNPALTGQASASTQHQYPAQAATHNTAGLDPSKWCDKAPNGKQYCRNFQFDRCKGGCRRSHQCPIKLHSGQPCNGEHKASQCPNRS